MLEERVNSMDEAWAKAAEILAQIREKFTTSQWDKYPRGGIYLSTKVSQDKDKGIERKLDCVMMLVEFERKYLTSGSLEFLRSLGFFEDYRGKVNVLEYPSVTYMIPYRVTETEIRPRAE